MHRRENLIFFERRRRRRRKIQLLQTRERERERERERRETRDAMLGVTTTTRSTFSTSAVSPCSSSSGRLAFRPRASSTSSKDVKRLGGNHSRWRCAQSSISISSISASSSSFGRGGGKRNVGVSVLQNEGEVNELIEKILEDVKVSCSFFSYPIFSSY